MKFFFRWALRLFVLLVMLVVAAILLLDTIVRKTVEYQIHRQTGLTAKIDEIHIGLFKPELVIKNFTLYNSPEFGGAPFIKMPELFLVYDRDALRDHKFHCTLMRFNLAEINLVEDKQGSNNVQALEQRIREWHLPKSETGVITNNANNPSRPAQVTMKFTGVDSLDLTLGKATYQRLNQQVEEFKMNVNHQVFADVKNQDDLSGVLLVALLRSSATIVQSNGRNWLDLLLPSRNDSH